ncbi:hypothetical protein GCM10011374_26690 [Kocuria dechangensis]|uniref:Uncharacterized protein n=1 Tax=Kocuria dechangensis TaxID=1176249 RepID=A0A917GYV6_9MICC|nr:hypothetical protein [Kocuria dechangensis]GGG62203.1 hypothetical protein GCM10011374_26690 [Kocuria dechangensis]
MDTRTPSERGGVVLSHPDRPVPSRRRLLLETVPADGVVLVAGLCAAWWAGTGGGRQWFVPGWAGVFVLAWLVLMLGRAPRPEVRRFSQRSDVHAARREARRTGRLPESPSVRVGVAARSCDQLELTVLLLTAGVTTGLGILLWPALPWAGIVVVWAALTALSLTGAVRGWIYLRLYETAHRRPPT